jgi:hypothetical protein
MGIHTDRGTINGPEVYYYLVTSQFIQRNILSSRTFIWKLGAGFSAMALVKDAVVDIG